MYTTFSGSNGHSAARWLQTFEHQVHNLEFLPPRMWLTCINGLLEADAALWADQHPRVKQILTDSNLKSISGVDVKTFKTAFLARFHPAEMTADYHRPPLFGETRSFAQDRSEDIDAYYQRALILLYEKGGVDVTEAPLTQLEKIALNATIVCYIHGLIVSTEIHRELESAWTESKESLGLLDIHNLAKSKVLELRQRTEHNLRTQGGLFSSIEKPRIIFDKPTDDGQITGPATSLFGGAAPRPTAAPTGSLFSNLPNRPANPQGFFGQGTLTGANPHNVHLTSHFGPAPEVPTGGLFSHLNKSSKAENLSSIFSNPSIFGAQMPTGGLFSNLNKPSKTEDLGSIFSKPASSGPPTPTGGLFSNLFGNTNNTSKTKNLSNLSGPAVTQSCNDFAPRMTFATSTNISNAENPSSVFAKSSEPATAFPSRLISGLFGAPANSYSTGTPNPHDNTKNPASQSSPAPTGALASTHNDASNTSAHDGSSIDNIGFDRKDEGI